MKSLFSRRLAEIRHATGLQQHQAAAQLGVSQALLSHYENGAREPKLEFVARICSFYGVSADYLLGLSERKSYAGTVALPYNTDEEQELAEELRNIAEHLHHIGDAELTAAAVRYLSLIGENVKRLLNSPDLLYDPKRDSKIKLTESEFIEHARRVSGGAEL